MVRVIYRLEDTGEGGIGSRIWQMTRSFLKREFYREGMPMRNPALQSAIRNLL